MGGLNPLPPRSDFGYYRPENQSVCVEQPELKGHDLEFCLYGRRELLRTSGYIPNPPPPTGHSVGLGVGGVLGAHRASPPPPHFVLGTARFLGTNAGEGRAPAGRRRT